MEKPLLENVKRTAKREAKRLGRAAILVSKDMTVNGVNLESVFGKVVHSVKEPHI